MPVFACAVDGQLGPQSPTVPATGKALIPASQVNALALYSDGGFMVLAPRDWRCVASYGSSGSHIRVVPPDAAVADSQLRFGKIETEAVVLDHWSGGTSGRFEVAGVGGPVFRNLAQFISTVQNSVPGTQIRTSPWPQEKVQTVSAPLIRFEDPPSVAGTGTNETGLSVSKVGINGIVREVPTANAIDLMVGAVRLEKSRAALTPTIVADMEERSKGK